MRFMRYSARARMSSKRPKQRKIIMQDFSKRRIDVLAVK